MSFRFNLFILLFLICAQVIWAKSMGTGFLISSDGLVATSNHVINNSDSIRFIYNGVVYTASTIAQDEANDLAILKVQGEFPFLEIKGSEETAVGDEVFTVGFPNPDVQGFEPKMTTGVISSLSGIKDNPTCYQISVPIQPGNSGGPLLKKDGAVVGIIRSSLNPMVTLVTANSLPENVNYAAKSDYLKLLVKITKANLEKRDLNNLKQKRAAGFSAIDRALACIGIVEANTFRESATLEPGNLQPADLFTPEPPFWSELMKELDSAIKLKESVDLVNLEDPWENYSEIRPKLHERIQKFMDEWKNSVKGYNAWLQGGLIGSAIRNGQYEEEFQRFKNETETFNYDWAIIVRKTLAYYKTSRKKIASHGRHLLAEKYEEEFRDLFLDENVLSIHGDVFEKSVLSAKKNGKNAVYPKAKIVYSDKIGIVCNDPTIKDSFGVNLFTFDMLEDCKKDGLVYEDNHEVVVLIVSYISGDPYLISTPKIPRAEIMLPKSNPNE